jgi:hypothetical protein
MIQKIALICPLFYVFKHFQGRSKEYGQTAFIDEKLSIPIEKYRQFSEIRLFLFELMRSE